MKAKFKIGDKVLVPSLKNFKGSIWNCYMNEPSNLKIIDGEFSYVVEHDNYRGKMVITYNFKESELIKE
jgi:hypothetical protein